MALLQVLVVVLLAACGAVGCWRPPVQRLLADISGTVTVDGSPLDNGTVTFVTPATGEVEVFLIRGGRFAGKAGIGERRVEFRRFGPAEERTAATDLAGPAAPFQVNTLPDHLGAMSTIAATVAADGTNNFAFDLRSHCPGN